jgi:spore maturation protein B
MQVISNLIIPFIVLTVIIYGSLKKVNVYDAFVDGSKEVFDLTYTMFPTILGMMFGINLLLGSNIIGTICNWLEPIFDFLHVPTDILPLALMRPISGSSSLAILNNLLSAHGPDSFIGRLASVIQGSTDTTFYIITLYFGCIGIKKIKYALWAGLFADLIGIIASVIFVSLIFY